MKNKTFLKWANRIKDTKTPWTENEIIYFRKAVGSSGLKELELRSKLLDMFNTILSEKSYKITEQQSIKGINYIKGVCFKKNGQLRDSKQNCFSDYEATIILNFRKFEFVGLHYASQNAYAFYTPIYRVISKQGRSFEYTTNMGRMEVV